MRDYQRQKNNKYILPSALYHQIIWQIRDYYRLKEEYESIPAMGRSVTDYDGMPHGSPSFDAMDKKIIRMDKLKQVIDIVETEKESIPEEYRQAVWNNILYRTAYVSEIMRLQEPYPFLLFYCLLPFRSPYRTFVLYSIIL